MQPDERKVGDMTWQEWEAFAKRDAVEASLLLAVHHLKMPMDVWKKAVQEIRQRLMDPVELTIDPGQFEAELTNLAKSIFHGTFSMTAGGPESSTTAQKMISAPSICSQGHRTRPS